ncbi:MAG: hypothetical protein AAGF47_05310 [Planctomycetota bacterium]
MDVVSDGVITLGGATASPLLQTLADANTPAGAAVDPSNTTASFEEAQDLEGIAAERQVHREYVWGPGNNGYDELIVCYDRDGKAQAHGSESVGFFQTVPTKQQTPHSPTLTPCKLSSPCTSSARSACSSVRACFT